MNLRALCASLIALASIIALILMVALLPAAHAQEVIMNQPSADVVDKGHIFLRSDSFYTQNPAYFFEQANFAYGLGHNLEVSLNVNDLAHTSTVYAFIAGFKYAPIKTKHFTLYVGDQYWKPFANKSSLNISFGPDAGTYNKEYSNGNVSYEAGALSLGNWRFTLGSFQSINALAPGNRAGVLDGIEWTAVKFKNGWMLEPGVDYATGAGTNGYLSPGLSFAKGSFFICPGYMIANAHNPNGAHQSFVMIGKTF